MAPKIGMDCVTRLVDDFAEPFRDRQFYRAHVDAQVTEFLSKVGNIRQLHLNQEWRGEENVSVCKLGDVSVVTRPAYRLVTAPREKKFEEITGDDTVVCPQFFITFNAHEKSRASKYVRVALDQFYLIQPDLDDGLAIFLWEDENLIAMGMSVLTRYLHPWAKIEARCNYFFANGHANYRVPLFR